MDILFSRDEMRYTGINPLDIQKTAATDSVPHLVERRITFDPLDEVPEWNIPCSPQVRKVHRFPSISSFLGKISVFVL